MQEPACHDKDLAIQHGLEHLTELFFSEDIYDLQQAKRICQMCDLRERCLERAIERKERSSVWGGVYFNKHGRIGIKRPIGRPMKDPEEQVYA